jgi:hypothetical protein
MNWSFSVKLMPGETVVDKPEDARLFGIKTVHTPILTNRRAMFKFNSLSTGLIQSFNYDEIDDARPANRLMIKYLRLICGSKEYYMNVDVPEEWALKIMGYKDQFGESPKAGAAHAAASSVHTPDELAAMLDALYTAGVITDEERAEKLARIRR